MTKALITGITGFAGSHLSELLLSKGWEVNGLIRPRSRMDNIAHILPNINLIPSDIRDSYSIHRALRDIKPDYIFHLAAQSFIPQSHSAPVDTIDANIKGTAIMLEALRKTKIDCVMQVAGSSEEYGEVHTDEVPIRETNPLRPRSPYAVSKVAADMLSQTYYHSYGVKTVVTRAFNHEGPRRGDVFVTSNFAKQIAEIEKHKREPVIYHGNLAAWRDFSDVRDIVRAYVMAVEKCQPGEVYNICSGHSIQICEMLEMLLRHSYVTIETRVDPARMRPSDINLYPGDCSKFKQATGWAPEIPLDKTLLDLLNYWRERM